jgi:hypothetical protein
MNIEEHVQHLVSMPRFAYLVISPEAAQQVADRGPFESQGTQWSVKIRDLGNGTARVQLEQIS